MSKLFFCNDCKTVDPDLFHPANRSRCRECCGKASVARRATRNQQRVLMNDYALPVPKQPVESVLKLPQAPAGSPDTTDATIDGLNKERARLYSQAAVRPLDIYELQRIKEIEKELPGWYDLLRRQVAAPGQRKHEARVQARVEDCREDLAV